MKWNRNLCVLLCCISTLISGNELKIASVFGNNMVLQQNTNVTVWGRGIPGSKITINTSWNENSTTMCSPDSSWSLILKTPSAGKQYSMVISDDYSKITLQNIAIGEVWLCSGQSNMEMPLKGWPPNDLIQNSKHEIETANYPDIRLYTVEKHISVNPEKTCNGEWVECNSQTAADFSATAYFFGKKLYQELSVPIGLIHSSWGGTPVEAWTSRKYLENRDDFKETFKNLENCLPAIDQLNRWLNSFPIVRMDQPHNTENWNQIDFQDDQCSQIAYNDSKWRVIDLPMLWESTEVGSFDGVVWFRKNVKIPEDWIGEELEITLGPIDDYDRTYINGELVGAIETDGNWQTPRIYQIPKTINLSGQMTIAVRVIDTQGGGGIYGKSNEMRLILKKTGDVIAIGGDWKYLPVAEYRNGEYFVFGAEDEKYFDRPVVPLELNADTPSVLYNGMIAPLVPFAIKGAIWYQGEDNVGRPQQYEELFPLMISNWRDDWKSKFPFYFVQIAPFNYGSQNHSEYLRDAQRKTLSLENTGMAVTLDIATVDNIHPPNKQDVGNRLAFWALAKQYGKDIVCSGPLYKEQKITGKKIIIRFDYADGLCIKPDIPNEFQVAGEDRVFYPAAVKIKGNELIVYSKKVKQPVAVRYAWSNTSAASLFNTAGLPTSSFRTDDW